MRSMMIKKVTQPNDAIDVDVAVAVADEKKRVAWRDLSADYVEQSMPMTMMMQQRSMIDWRMARVARTVPTQTMMSMRLSAQHRSNSHPDCSCCNQPIHRFFLKKNVVSVRSNRTCDT